MPISPTSSLPITTWEAHTTSTYGDIPRAATPVSDTERDLAPERRYRAAEDYFNEVDRYAEDTHPDSVRLLEARLPHSLPPTYWQAMGKDSPLPEHVEDGGLPPINEQAVGAYEYPDEEGLMFDPALSGRALAQALKHVRRLDDLLKNTEQLSTLLRARDGQGGTSIDVDTVASLGQKIHSLRSDWASGQFAGSSRGLSHLANNFVPVHRAQRETDLKDSIAELWTVAKKDYREEYLTDRNADQTLVEILFMVEGLKKAEI